MINKQNRLTRRQFVKNSMLASASVMTALSMKDQVLFAQQGQAVPVPKSSPASKDTLPMGKIGDVEFSRLMLGSNVLPNGFCHARDLRYVNDLARRYNTPEKMLETLAIAEAHGINCVNVSVSCHQIPIIRRYKNECGGKIKWMAVLEVPDPANPNEFIEQNIDGADAAYIQGGIAERLLTPDKVGYLGKMVDLIKLRGIPAGIAGHSLRVVEECEKAKFNVDFYVKTLHTSNYFSFQRPVDKGKPYGDHDNMWCTDANEVIEFMKNVGKPWIAYKVLAAGAIPPAQGFQHAFNNGADFILVGMFDWQIAEDVKITSEALSNVKRTRPWRA
ncbi:MAG: hypothetical protein PHR77_00350 [Kiritimatiellae bacterium]|nr:hypothetical protein [Kiritimatiellia bacterium]MDD5519831.1 hypothetical protein [Kiritimatiellia bacterium]